MSITGISGTSTLDYQMELQLQKEEEKKSTEQVATQQAQITGLVDTGSTNVPTASSPSDRTKDTLEISKEGRAYQLKSQSDSVSNSSESGTDSTQNLTSLTEAEIQKLVDKGTISQAEADKELMRRTSEKSKNESSNDTKLEPYMEEES
ncbi:hypothetical protein [Lacrimispora algidixylanolytica]|uniref:Uncharacterized protein n=1 Tax=Lacrimispora algidixylanolytica TaxID=94868 RepID=A0A419T583_9FIRM|nr:hypothetical protein [Lacrimispora algidixylanolytica]RKD32593.1 hypothetical protein BET01_16930 [Lacrimispora algidixylanolytica]